MFVTGGLAGQGSTAFTALDVPRATQTGTVPVFCTQRVGPPAGIATLPEVVEADKLPVPVEVTTYAMVGCGACASAGNATNRSADSRSANCFMKLACVSLRELMT
jgi:hypothetical protein